MPGAASGPRECTKAHTRILRAMLAVEDCVAYWKKSKAQGTLAERTRTAFEGHWFGTKSEQRVKTLLGDMALRFDAYPAALMALREWSPPREVAPWVCHFHTQLADPIYRHFTGNYLPERLNRGYLEVDREAVARWMQESWRERWAPTTCMKFGANLLATAFEAGLLKDRKDPRRLTPPRVPAIALEYLLYLLREVSIEGGPLESPYLRSVLPTLEVRVDAFRSLRTVHLSALGDVRDLRWDYPDVLTWARSRSNGNIGSGWAQVQGGL